MRDLKIEVMKSSSNNLDNDKGNSLQLFSRKSEIKEEEMSANAEPNVVPLCDILLVLLGVEADFHTFEPLLSLEEEYHHIPCVADRHHVLLPLLLPNLQDARHLNRNATKYQNQRGLHDECGPRSGRGI